MALTRRSSPGVGDGAAADDAVGSGCSAVAVGAVLGVVLGDSLPQAPNARQMARIAATLRRPMGAALRRIGRWLGAGALWRADPRASSRATGAGEPPYPTASSRSSRKAAARAGSW